MDNRFVIGDEDAVGIIIERAEANKYSEGQARDDHGRWSSGVGGGGAFKDYTGLQIDDFYTENSNGNITPEQQKSIEKYQLTDSYQRINSVLRKGLPGGRYEETINNLDAAIAQTPGLARDTTLYRGIMESNTISMNSLSVGSVMTDKAFTSTTANRAFAEHWSAEEGYGPKGFRMDINVPKGTKGLVTNKVTNSPKYDREVEFLLGRGNSFRITSIDTKQRIVKAELVR